MLLKLILNFFDADGIINGKPAKVFKYEEILKEQLLISFLSDGNISLTELNNFPVNDRRIILTTLQYLANEKKKRHEARKEELQRKQHKRNF